MEEDGSLYKTMRYRALFESKLRTLGAIPPGPLVNEAGPLLAFVQVGRPFRFGIAPWVAPSDFFGGIGLGDSEMTRGSAFSSIRFREPGFATRQSGVVLRGLSIVDVRPGIG